MKLHSPETIKVHEEIVNGYKDRLATLEKEDADEQEEPFERSFIYNAIYLHTLWFEQLEGNKDRTSSPLLEEILNRRESDIGTFEDWINGFAKDAQPNGWAIWGWSYPLKTFVGFPIRSHDDGIPIGVTPLLVIDCWEHAYLNDFGTDFDSYLEEFWRNVNYEVIERRHQEMATTLGFNVK